MLPYDWKEKLKPANLRNTVNENAMAVSIAMGVVLIIGFWWIGRESGFWGHKETPGINQVFLIDEETGELTKGSGGDITPLMGKGGKPTLVNVIYGTCTTCADKKPVYYRKYTDQVKALLDQHQKDAPGLPPSMNDSMLIEMGELVRLPEKGSQWYSTQSMQGNMIRNQATVCPGNQTFQVCPAE